MVLSVHAIGQLVPSDPRAPLLWAIVRDRLNSGFQLFFVISGFLIAGPFLRKLVSGDPLPVTWAYALRRVARIGPAFWVVLLAFLLVSSAPDWGSVVTHALFVHDLVLHQSGAILPVAWTLGIEALFYAFVPIAASLMRRRGLVTARALTRCVLFAWALSALWELIVSLAFAGPYGSGAVSPHDDVMKLFSISLPGLFYMFCPGLLVAIWRIERGRPARLGERFPRALVVAGCLIWLLAAAEQAMVSSGIGAFVADQVRGVAFGAILLGAVSWNRAPGIMSRPLAALGLVSYGVYLWHWLVVHGIEIAAGRAAPFGGPLGAPLAVTVTLIATLPFAILSWYLVESPALRLAGAVTRRGRLDQPSVALRLEAESAAGR